MLSIGDVAKSIRRPDHQVRTVWDQLNPNAPRFKNCRQIPPDRVCEVAAAVQARYGSPDREAVHA